MENFLLFNCLENLFLVIDGWFLVRMLRSFCARLGDLFWENVGCEFVWIKDR